MMALTDRQLAWLRDLLASNSPKDIANPNHPAWQEYDHLQALALSQDESHTASKASRV